MSALQNILTPFRTAAKTEREKGTYFEELVCTYFRNEPVYKDLYSDVWLFSNWAKAHQYDARDIGIDLVAKTRATNEVHAIQCKFYDESYRIQKKDIDSFLATSGQAPFKHRYIVTTTNNWNDNAEAVLVNQQIPITKLGLSDLESSQIDWSKYKPTKTPMLREKKSLLPHQRTAVQQVFAGLQKADRGKLIMACGTGKTFTSLKIAEEIAGPGKQVLFLVPSLALMSQTLTEWTQDSTTPLHAFAVCSDSEVGKRRKKDDDIVQTFAHELRYPATTDPQRLAEEVAKRHDSQHMSVVFSTYHSIDVISAAQYGYKLKDFDLIICDEAHRTTGATFGDEAESNFVKVHDASFIKTAKRLYMTATPRIYGDSAKIAAEKGDVALCSMDDENLYGKELHILTFSESVKRDLLVDYKVLVLAVDEAHITARLQNLLKDASNQLRVDDAAKIVGCWKALSKQGTADDLGDDTVPMRKAVAFCQVIEPSAGKTKHKVSSKNIASMFQAVVEAYKEQDETDTTLVCEARHVDGSMHAGEKEASLAWLKADTHVDTCRILSNVRCLSEGVDVPALDAVLFLTPRNSQVDVVQSVGRVMRKAPGKQRGYVILPVVIPAGMEPHDALNDNQVYKVVWEVLQALRSHDDRFDAMINKLDLIGKDVRKMEVIAITDKLQKKAGKPAPSATAKGKRTIGEPERPAYPTEQVPMAYEISEIERALYAKVVKKCGNRNHWEDWANDIAKIARTHISRIQAILDHPANQKEIGAFDAFAAELRDDLNDSITDAEIVEMLAQHLITKPVFDALFEGYSFAQHNPMSQAMQAVLDVLQEHHLDKEAATLEKFYASVKLRAEGIDNAAGKQKIVVELYDRFFANAFPKLRDKLGIVYTPIDVVDFIIHSVSHILQTEFGQTLGSKDVHILDPFTGTGTFITRLLQSGLIKPEELPHKYKHEIHANEIVLLAYYIAAINIEAVYHSIVGGEYRPFEGICLTDTFQLYEKEDLVDTILVNNSARRRRQKKLDIRVILGNPPYSSGQSSANDDNQNVSYPHLDQRVRDTYAKESTATSTKNLMDSYVRAIRWASDRIGEAGVIGFVSGSGFVEKPAMDGLRKCLVKEFTNIHVLNLRGDIRKNILSKGRAREGQNIFESGSMTGIAITFFVKNPDAKQHGQIFYHDIGNDLTTLEKKDVIRSFVDISGIADANGWQTITPDQHGDWLKQRDESMRKFPLLGDKKGNNEKIFINFSLGLNTNRDSWCYNSAKVSVLENMRRMIDFYNLEVIRFKAICGDLDKKTRENSISGLISTDSTKIKWSSSLIDDLVRLKQGNFKTHQILQSLYRPFTKQWLFYDAMFNHRVGQMPRIFPDTQSQNIVICVSGVGARSGFSALISNAMPDLHALDTGQCFPLYLYEFTDEHRPIDLNRTGDIFAAIPDTRDTGKGRYKRTDAITDSGLQHFQASYPGENISKEDLFYYIYGLLHSPDYRERYADNLTKELPRIPAVKTTNDFWHFSKEGRNLAELHLNYETVLPYPVKMEVAGKTALTDADYRVEKMKYGKNGKNKDLTTLVYNHRITLTGIPLEAYDYVVNGKPALDWVVERQCVKTDKDSGIVNDANDWAIDTMNNPKYPLELFQRVITVSLETMKIVHALPKLDIH